MPTIAIVGAAGYGGGELIRLLARHRRVTIGAAVSSTYAGKPVWEGFPGMAGRIDLVYEPTAATDRLAQCDYVFLARDNGAAMRQAPDLVAAGCRVIDLSADFRFRDTGIYDAWYKGPHASPDLSAAAAYGLPELHREAIRTASVVGNPGCYTTASILALAPLFAASPATPGVGGLVDPRSIVVDAKSGISGGGRAKYCQEFHFAEANESTTAYKIAGTHRHTPEIEQEVSRLAGAPLTVTFTPHLVPMTRGILATCYAQLTTDVGRDELLARYRSFYAGEPFVWITDGLPSTKHTALSNMCHIGLGVDDRTGRVTVVAALDNLGKGQASQAIQNLNVMAGFPEAEGLEMCSMWP